MGYHAGLNGKHDCTPIAATKTFSRGIKSFWISPSPGASRDWPMMDPFHMLIKAAAPNTYRFDVDRSWRARVFSEFNVERPHRYIRHPTALGGDTTGKTNSAGPVKGIHDGHLEHVV